MHDVIVLNAFHRGDWFIDQLTAQGKNVHVFDWSEKMGERSDAEMLGPFGLFGEEKMNPQLGAWLNKNYDKHLQNSGWSVWSDFGTFEAQGPFRVPQYFQNEKWINPIFKNFISKIDWPRNFWETSGTTMNPVHDYWVLKSAGPKVRGISLQAEDIISLQIHRENKSIHVNDKVWSAPFFVFFLNSYEMAPFFDEGLAAQVRGEILRPRFCWQRFQVKIETEASLQQMPVRSLLVDKSQDPWWEENFLVLHKTSNAGEFDVWLRSYFDFHQNEDYFHKMYDSIVPLLRNKFSASAIHCLEKPKELTHANYQSLFPIYDSATWEKQSSWYADGLFYVGTEKVNDFLFSTYWALQNLILQGLTETKKVSETRP